MDSQSPKTVGNGTDIRDNSTKAGAPAEAWDIDLSGFTKETAMTKIEEELAERRRANTLLKWIIAALALLLCLSIAATVGAVYALIAQQNDTQSARGALTDAASGETLRTAPAAEQLEYNLMLASPDNATALLKEILPEVQTLEDLVDALIASNATIASGNPPLYYQAYLLPQNITNGTAAATGLRALGVIEPDISERMCAYFNEGHQTVQFNVHSDGDTFSRVQAGLINAGGCQERQTSRIFSMQNGADSLILTCDVGRGCILISLSTLKLSPANSTSAGSTESGRRRLMQAHQPSGLEALERLRQYLEQSEGRVPYQRGSDPSDPLPFIMNVLQARRCEMGYPLAEDFCGPLPWESSLTFYISKVEVVETESGPPNNSTRCTSLDGCTVLSKQCIFTQCTFDEATCLADPSYPWINCKSVASSCEIGWSTSQSCRVL